MRIAYDPGYLRLRPAVRGKRNEISYSTIHGFNATPLSIAKPTISPLLQEVQAAHRRNEYYQIPDPAQE
jgi:hypothetical protein